MVGGTERDVETLATIQHEKSFEQLKVRLSDYLKFDGKTHSWKAFYDSFTSIASLNHIEDLLKETLGHEDKFAQDSTYRTRCHYLFNFLKVSCTKGLALPKAKAYKATSDGYKPGKTYTSTTTHMAMLIHMSACF